MTDFEKILEQCLDDLELGASNVDECLARHPKHSAQLRPILLATERLAQGQTVRPSAAFKARARARLTQHMQSHPRKRAWFNFAFGRLATNLAIVVLTLFIVTGTVYAQAALPGDMLYAWKLGSERIWRAVSPDPVQTDIAIANRRMAEMNAVADNPVLKAEAWRGYQEVLTRLESELDAETLEEILPVIEVEQEPVDNPAQPGPTPLLHITVTPQPVSTNLPVPTVAIFPPTSLPTIEPTVLIPLPIP
jgi:hypothetical protein